MANYFAIIHCRKSYNTGPDLPQMRMTDGKNYNF
jgi:hypothetical protein